MCSPPHQKVAGTDEAPTTPKSETRPQPKRLQENSKYIYDDINRALPHALGQEKAVLSVLMQNPNKLAEPHGITPKTFYKPAHQILFKLFRDIAKDGTPEDVEIVALVQRLIDMGQLEAVGGPAAITEIACYCPSASHFAAHCQTLHEKHGERLLVLAGIAAMNGDEPEHARLMSEREQITKNGFSKESKFKFIRADSIKKSEGAFDFVEDLLTEGAASVIYGQSNSGKSFLAFDLAAAVATGRSWMARQCEQGAVICITLEGQHGARNRIRALQLSGRLPEGTPFFLCFAPVNLLDPTHGAEIKRLIENIQAVEPLPVRLIIIDTLARAMAGGDENSGKDMGEAVKTIDAARQATGAHICIIHHSGKDAARGARGHSSLRAAIDTEIEVIHPDGDKYRTATIVKQRDIATRPAICFSLDVVDVGTNRRGKPITSCVVIEQDPIMAHTKGKPGAKLQFTCEMILALLPQATIPAWEKVSMRDTGMSKDTFHDRKRECADRWEKVGDQIVLKSLKDKRKWGNGEMSF